METEIAGALERNILVHLLEHRGHQVRFEADQWTTEFGILRSFPGTDANIVRGALRNLEMAKWIYRRVQYVIGYSEPKLVYSLTPSGHRKAMVLQRDGGTGEEPLAASVGPEPSSGPWIGVSRFIPSDRRDSGE
jgi:DNA-binding HxlR family transcriptional regulator